MGIGPYNFALLPGRFQPFTAGHLKAYSYARQKHTVALGLVVRRSGKLDEDNPFDTLERLRLIQKVLPSSIVYRISCLHYDTIVEEIGAPVMLVLGSDRVRELKGNFSLEVPRTDEDTSATRVREALRRNDRVTFNRLMPSNLHVEFDRLRELVDAYK